MLKPPSAGPSGSLPAESTQNHKGKGPKGKDQAAETRAEAWAREMREAAAAEEARKAKEKAAEATRKRSEGHDCSRLPDVLWQP